MPKSQAFYDGAKAGKKWAESDHKDGWREAVKRLCPHPKDVEQFGDWEEGFGRAYEMVENERMIDPNDLPLEEIQEWVDRGKEANED